jgi:hypothetical protein
MCCFVFFLLYYGEELVSNEEPMVSGMNIDTTSLLIYSVLWGAIQCAGSIEINKLFRSLKYAYNIHIFTSTFYDAFLTRSALTVSYVVHEMAADGP